MKNKAFTLIEAIVVLVILAILVMIVGGIAAGSGCGQKVSAEEKAQEWANKMYPGKNPRVSCTNIDSNADGYVSSPLLLMVRMENHKLFQSNVLFLMTSEMKGVRYRRLELLETNPKHF